MQILSILPKDSSNNQLRQCRQFWDLLEIWALSVRASHRTTERARDAETFILQLSVLPGDPFLERNGQILTRIQRARELSQLLDSGLFDVLACSLAPLLPRNVT